MKKMTKILSVILCCVLIIQSSPSFALSTTIAGRRNLLIDRQMDKVNKYLLEAGYPIELLAELDDESKLEYYEKGCSFESMSTTYGIFTEDYRIEYSLDDAGNVVIDSENMAMFEELIQDRAAVEKIIADNIASGTVISPAIAQLTSFDEINAMRPKATIQALSNWRASITCSHVSYTNQVARKYVKYIWKWSYNPAWTLTDKPAVAWSGGFTAEPETIRWTYTREYESGDYFIESDYGYDDYNPGAGVAAAIDIKGPKPKDLYATTTHEYDNIKYHSGTLSLDLTKRTSENSRESVVGRYYHTQIRPTLSLGFSESGPSISVSASFSYSQSSDTAAAFWATSR